MLRLHVQVIPPFGKLTYKVIGQAMHESGRMVADVLTAALNGQVIPGMSGPIHRPELVAKIERHDLGLFEFTVTAPDEIYAIEQGRPPWDMKPSLINGKRSRPLKDGSGRYNIIPFTHRNEELPGAVAEMAQRLTLSEVVGSYADSEQKIRNTYAWGTDTGDTSNIVPPATHPQMGGMQGPYTHKASKFSNMYKFSSGLVTFRTVSTHSPQASWWHPAIEPNPIMNPVEEFVSPMIESYLAAVWEQELSHFD